jgi:hypothetical protein
MVNYDLPWNPNRLEQRFGRIHRINQTEVCHLWNLVAENTREGEVYERLLEKLEAERRALGGKDSVYDVLGKLFRGTALRDLLLEAIRYGERPEVKRRLYEKVDRTVDRQHILQLLEEQQLVHDVLDASKIQRIREEMERAEAQKLQPHYIGSFFLEAFRFLGGTVHERENGRYEITHVPSPIRTRQAGVGPAIQQRYHRITFEKDLINVQDRPEAEYVCPGHPLLDSTIALLLDRHLGLLKQGTVLVDMADESTDLRAMSVAEHAIEAPVMRNGMRPVSKRLQFVELSRDRQPKRGGPAPHLNYEPAREDVLSVLGDHLDWVGTEAEDRVRQYAIEALVPSHVDEVQRRRGELITRTMAAVKDRLTKEALHWDSRAQELKAQEAAGKQPRMNWQRAAERAAELRDRLNARMHELERERHLAPRPPVVLGAAVVVPAGMLRRLRGEPIDEQDQARKRRVEELAMEAVLQAERALGYEPRDVSMENLGYDVESRSRDGHLRFIEVKGRAKGAETITVTRNEITTALNTPERFILAVVLVDDEQAEAPRYIRRPFRREPDFKATSVNYDLSELLADSSAPT